MEKLAQVKLREAGQTLLFSYQEEEKAPAAATAEPVKSRIKIGDYCIVEADRGCDYGHVVSCGLNIADKTQEEPIRKIIRQASANDLKQIDENKIKAKEASSNCQNKIREHKLNMKLIDCEYSFDRGKIIFYFTAESRIDFRELVKDLPMDSVKAMFICVAKSPTADFFLYSLILSNTTIVSCMEKLIAVKTAVINNASTSTPITFPSIENIPNTTNKS